MSHFFGALRAAPLASITIVTKLLVPTNALAARFLQGSKIFHARTHRNVETISPVNVSADVFLLDAANISSNPFD